MAPDTPAGTTQPCCQPLTLIGSSSAPSAERAVQPGLMLSGTTSTRCASDAVTSTSRWSGCHCVVSAEVIAALGNVAASGPASCTPSATNAGPGLITSSCSPAG